MIAATLAISHRLDGRIVRGCPRLALARAFMRGKTATIRLALQQIELYLADRDLSNVDVKFENGHVDLTAREEKSASSNAAAGTMQSVERGRYEEMIALHGPVKDRRSQGCKHCRYSPKGITMSIR